MSETMDEWRERAALEPPAPKRVSPPDGPVDWANEERLGAMPDSLLALEMGLSRGAVYQARIKMGIPAYRPGPRECLQCQREFTPRRYDGVYCCPHCRQKARGRDKQPIPATLRRQVMVRDGFACRYCGRTVQDGVKLHVDHVIPDADGGPTEEHNLVTACDTCNMGKGDRDRAEPVPIGQHRHTRRPFSAWMQEVEEGDSVRGD